MDPNYPPRPGPGHGGPPQIGFELANMEAGQGFEGVNGAPNQEQLYPPLDPANPPPSNGPTPTETTPTGGGGAPIGFENQQDKTNTAPSPVAPLDSEEKDDKIQLLSYKEVIQDEIEKPATVVEMATSREFSDEIEAKRETIYFRDGKRIIDFVLTYKDADDASKDEKRKLFEKNLEEEGLELEHEDKRDGTTHFVKVHAPWEVLTRLAELLCLKMPIQEYDQGINASGCLEMIPNPFELPDHLFPDEKDYFTADFSRDRESMFIIEDKATFFTNAQRSLMVCQLLLRAKYEDGDKTKYGIDRLIRHNIYTQAFPLHEGRYTSTHSVLTQGVKNSRHLLYETWAKPTRWYFNQPLDQIRTYFGEKIGIYFAWLGFYTTMLIPASAVGLIVFIYGCATVFLNAPSEEICDENGPGNLTMCPLCDKRCSYWRLHTSCNYSRLTYLFDNYGTVFFAGFMAIWATMFLEFWKRKQAELQYDWDVASFAHEEHMRPDFEAKVKNKKLNPVTQEYEPFLPFYSKAGRRCTSITVVAFMICCVLAAVFGVIMYRIIVVALLYAAPSNIVRQNAKITTTATAALISLIIIMLLNRLYQKIAYWLTELEKPRTDSEYENSYTFKMFMFQFVNYYSSLVYIAFFKGRLGGRPGEYDYRLGYRAEECDPAGCLIELCIQLAIVMVGKQAFNNFKEIMLPKILNWFRSRSAKKNESEDNLYTRIEQDSDLSAFPPMGLFEEYLEMVIQYGFVTIFVAAFPLAPLFALINNVIEIRLDAYKFVAVWQRPVGTRAMDIGIWYGILRGVTFIAVLSNAFIIGWTSDFIPKMVYKFTVSPNNNLVGYINNSLSYFAVEDFQNRSIPDDPQVDKFGVVTICRYADYRQPPWAESPLQKYDYTREYWHVFCARLAFVIVFEHAVFFLTWLVMYMIPDVPARVKTLMLRELHLAKEARYSSAFSTVKQDREKRLESESKTA